MMELSDYWAAVRRGWWLIVIFGLVGLAVPLVLAPPPKGQIETHYQSTSVIGTPPTPGSGNPSLLGGGITIGQIEYYASTDKVMDDTSRLSGLNEPVPVVRGQISLVAPSETGNSGQNSSSSSGQNGVVDVTAIGATPADALALAQGFVQAMKDDTNAAAFNALIGEERATEETLSTVMTNIAENKLPPGLTPQALEVQVTALQNYLASLVIQQPGSGLQVAQAPSAGSTTAVTTGTPTVVQNRTLRAAVGLLIGLILGALAAVALWLLDRRLKTAKRAQVALGYPVVAEIPFEASDSAETYRMLWLSVFREPLPLPPAEQNERWYEGEDPVLDHGGEPVRAGGSAMSEPITPRPLVRRSNHDTDRRVVMVTSADVEPSLSDVVTKLATVCAEVGQLVALVSTAGLSSPGVDSEMPQSPPLWWKQWPIPGNGARLPIEEERLRLLTGPLNPADVEHLLGETGVPGVSRLDLRYFVGQPAQVVIRVPEVLAALRQIVDVVFLEVPSYLSVHHGEGLTSLADAVLVVAEREATTLDEMRRLSAALRRLEAPVVGMALTDGGLEIYDWGRVDSQLENADEQPSHELEPTEQVPVADSAGVAAAPSFDELPVVEHAPREV